MFNGLVFHIVPVGIGKVQQQTLNRQLSSKGGIVVNDLDDFLELDDSQRLVISSLEYPKLAAYIGSEDDLKGIRLHRPEWVSTSLLKGSLALDYEFTIEKKVDLFAMTSLSKSSEQLAKENLKKRDRDTFEPSFELTSPKRARVDYKAGVKLENSPTLSLQLDDDFPQIKKEPSIRVKKEEGREASWSDSDDVEVLRSSTGAKIDFSTHLANFDIKPEIKAEEGVEEFEKEGEPWYAGLLNPFSPKKKAQGSLLEVKNEKDVKEEDLKDSKEDIKELVKISKESFSSLFSSSSDSMNASENNTAGISQYVMSVPEDVRRRNERFRARFSVSKSSVDKKENLNKHITDKLEILEKHCDSNNDKWRSVAYNKAVRALKNASFAVQTPDDILKVPNIGKRIYDKIVEILETGTLRRAEMESNDERGKVFALFTDVWGAGPATVSRWYAQGLRTLDEVLAKAHKLTPQQRIGIKYYHEFKMRIPRDEVSTIGDIVSSVAHQIDPQLKLVLGGSFRRGRDTCGDIDILVTHKKTSCLPGILAKIVKALHLLELLTDDLVSVDDDSDFYMGVCALKNTQKPHRRIDIRIFPKENWGPALLYFTGSKNFNRSMRLWASKVGFHLGNELVRMIGGEQGELIPCKTEEEVFKVLGLEYRRPEEREI